MKTIFILFTCLLCSLNVMAQQDKGTATATISVKGNCEECKKRIENAADIKGVKFSEWNETTQAITVTYKTDKVSLEQIEKAIAASGHDTKNIKSGKPAYNQLPSCCKYRDKSCESGIK
jgi:periplasmic mercuric ion binding protein